MTNRIIFFVLLIPTIFIYSQDTNIDLNTDILQSADFIYSLKSTSDMISSTKNIGYSGGPLDGITTRQLSNAPFLYKNCAPGIVLLVAIDASSMGSGSIINKDGEIVTNWHVVEGQDKMLVWLYDEKTPSLKDLDPDKFSIAEVKAVDKSRDLALLKLTENKPGIKPLDFGADYQIQVAQDVFAIGHPETYLWSFTYGVISRLPTDEEWYYSNGASFVADVIQTQTPTNPGNSGGPLFNDKGHLIGINSYGSPSGEGLNFAVRLREVEDFLTEVKSGKHTALETNKVTKRNEDIEWIPLDMNGNGIIDAYTTDSQGDGFRDIMQVDVNEDGIIDKIVIDTNRDGKIDIIAYDKDENGTYEYFLMDNDYDDVYETVGWDTDGDSIPDSFSESSG